MPLENSAGKVDPTHPYPTLSLGCTVESLVNDQARDKNAGRLRQN